MVFRTGDGRIKQLFASGADAWADDGVVDDARRGHRWAWPPLAWPQNAFWGLIAHSVAKERAFGQVDWPQNAHSSRKTHSVSTLIPCNRFKPVSEVADCSSVERDGVFIVPVVAV